MLFGFLIPGASPSGFATWRIVSRALRPKVYRDPRSCTCSPSETLKENLQMSRLTSIAKYLSKAILQNIANRSRSDKSVFIHSFHFLRGSCRVLPTGSWRW